jgi:hypothetical protein
MNAVKPKKVLELTSLCKITLDLYRVFVVYLGIGNGDVII